MSMAVPVPAYRFVFGLVGVPVSGSVRLVHTVSCKPFP